MTSLRSIWIMVSGVGVSCLTRTNDAEVQHLLCSRATETTDEVLEAQANGNCI